MSFSRQANPVWVFTDLDGNICDDTYYMHFLSNTFPYLPQNVYQTEDGPLGAIWNNPLQLNANGTLPNNLYFEEGVVYRLELRQGDQQSDPLIDLIENYVVEGNTDPTPDVTLPIDNQITNPGFAQVYFNDQMTIDNSGTNPHEIAPGWFLDISSTGSATVTVQREEIAGDQNVPTSSPTNPGYALKITGSSGTFSYIRLRQRFKYIPGLWASGGLSVSFTARIDSGVGGSITAYYKPSDGDTKQIVGATVSTAWQAINGGAQLDVSTSADTGDDAYVDVYIDLPITGTTHITNVQVIASPQSAAYPYGQLSSERQLDQSYNVYHDSELRQPKANLLTGWTFATNPWQFRSYASANLATNDYTADQTIVVQQNYVASATGNNVAVGAMTVADNYDFEVKAVTANNKFAIIQYIDPATAWPYWGQVLSAMVVAKLRTSNATTVRIKARVIYRSSLPPTITQTEPVASWSTTAGVGPTLAAGWTGVAPIGDPIYTLTGDHQKFVFEKFQLPAADSDEMTLGLMVYTVDEMDETGTPDAVQIRRVSLVNNEFAIDAPAETFDETLRKCQFYYEKSYDYNVLPGTATASNCVSIYSKGDSDSTQTEVWPPRIHFKYKTVKRKSDPTITFYSLSGTSGNVSVEAKSGTNTNYSTRADRLISTGSSQWTKTDQGSDFVTYYCNANTTYIYRNGGASEIQAQGYTNFHYTIDARLGKP